MALRPETLGITTSEISAAFQELAKTAQSINAESDKLTKTIEKLDIALRVLNLGVSAWVQFDKWAGDQDVYGYNRIGYDKIYGSWGLCLQTVKIDDGRGGDESVTGWNFNAAPRELRISAISHIFELIKALNKAAADVAKSLATRNYHAERLAEALGMPADDIGPSVELKQIQKEEK
jgi:hypothetical protein